MHYFFIVFLTKLIEKGAAYHHAGLTNRQRQIIEKGFREKMFQNYQINPAVMDKAKDNAIFLHCLPAIRGQEISEDLFEDKRSKVWIQAENRLHAQKALLVELLS